MSSAIITAFESVGVVSLSVAASFDVSKSIIEMIRVSAWEFTTAISYNLSDMVKYGKIRSCPGQSKVHMRLR